ncbi:heparinase II/III family protein [Acetobacter indonesiensis]|uniref:heparinase II/III family protein n=1 Tax=Acetobacter indonesiensis TaxID=104101 RepID=UPI0020A4C7AA|nr:heparinase II/III family protein [Acetobacter indonesiensis]MCP1230629.1 heparinase II/III family protein [Acetobacter indonesiensis]
MPLRRWTRNTRLALAMRNPLGGFGRVPAAPALTLRDPWPGDPIVGERLVRNQTLFEGELRNLQHRQWDNPAWPDSYRRWLQSFGWLRDLRELGADSARIKARSLVATWITMPAAERPVSDPSITGARLAAWLSYYEFFAAAADDNFRQSLMAALIMEARSIMALMPDEAEGWHALTALKGLLAVAVAVPDHPEFLSRYLKLIDDEIEEQILPDGGHKTRCPEDQFQTVRELAEMLSILQAGRLPLPTTLMEAADRAAPVLRAMRHGDGGLMLFNGSMERNAQLIEHVLNRASRSRILSASLPETGYSRLASGRALLIADTGTSAPTGYDKTAHAGMLSFEFSSGRQRLIVNCGASTQRGWAQALRQAAAHSVLEFAEISPISIDRTGAVTKRPKVTQAHATQDGAHWLYMTHDGYKAQGGGLYARQLYLGKDGQTLRGEETLQGGNRADYQVRFHLHPDVTVEQAENGFLLHTQEESWLFQSDARASVEESIYLGGPQRVPSLQIVLTPTVPPEPVSVAAEDMPEAGEHPEQDGHPIAEPETPIVQSGYEDHPDNFYQDATAIHAADPYGQQDNYTHSGDATLPATSEDHPLEAAVSAPIVEQPPHPPIAEEDDYAPIMRDPPPADSIPSLLGGVTHLHRAPAKQQPSMAEALFAEQRRAQAAAAREARKAEAAHAAAETGVLPPPFAKQNDQQPSFCPPIRWALSLVSE